MVTWCSAAVADAFYSCPDVLFQMKAKKVIVFTDGAAEPNPGPAAIGAVIKDEQGKVITTISQSIGRATNNQAEYWAIITAMEEAIKLGTTHIELKSDSELVVRQINGIYRVKKLELKPLYQKVKHLQGLLQGFTVTYIPRWQNAEADRLASLALGLPVD